jgi:hypothetical protein
MEYGDELSTQKSHCMYVNSIPNTEAELIFRALRSGELFVPETVPD